MTKLAFFDMDGVLCQPIYVKDGKELPGFPLEQWILYCKEHGEDTYENCKPLPAVRAYAEELKAVGAELFVLTGAADPIEIDAKNKFVQRNYAGLFRDVVGVGAASEKIPYIRGVANAMGISLSDCELIEDDYMTTLDAAVIGIKATHISAFLA